MSKIRRCIYVLTPTGCRLHRIYKSRYNPVEGDKTACGLIINTTWRRPSFRDNVGMSLCAKCEKANV